MSVMPPVGSPELVDPFDPADLVIRPATLGDLGDFLNLASLAGPGFTSLPVSEELLAERLDQSEQAFAGAAQTLMLALEDMGSARVIGCAAVKPGGMPRQDFLNFRVCNDDGTLTSTEAYADLTEVGSLLLHPDYRCAGIGPWLARSRYLLIATDLPRFGAKIFSELRGLVDAEGRSPFYDAVGARFFDHDFTEADDLCARGLQAELNAKVPASPLRLADLTESALDAIGRPNKDGARALDYLQEEGFRFEGVVDLLDGGPAVVIDSVEIRTISNSFTTSITSGHVESDRCQLAYLATGDGPDFRCIRGQVVDDGDRLICSSDLLGRLDVRPGSNVRAHLADQKRGRKRPSAVAEACR
jgi:arginine N-succinyltransferase